MLTKESGQQGKDILVIIDEQEGRARNSLILKEAARLKQVVTKSFPINGLSLHASIILGIS